MSSKNSYQHVPPLSNNWLAPFYDFSCELVGLGEIFRILKPGGIVVVADFGPTKSAWITTLFHLFENVEYLKGNLDGLIPLYLKQAGFSDLKIIGKHYPSVIILSAQRG